MAQRCWEPRNDGDRRMWRSRIGRLRLAGYVEGTTLILLLCVAVPLKYWGGDPALVRVLGPLHGLCFVAYLALAAEIVADGTWTPRASARVLGASVLPFGPFLNDGFLAQRSRVADQTGAGRRP